MSGSRLYAKQTKHGHFKMLCAVGVVLRLTCKELIIMCKCVIVKQVGFSRDIKVSDVPSGSKLFYRGRNEVSKLTNRISVPKTDV